MKFAEFVVTLILFLVFWCVVSLGLAFAADWTVSFWLTFSGRPDTFGYWHGFLLCLVPGLGQCVLPAWAITLVMSYFI